MPQTINAKPPPHDDELERAALGSLLEDADAVVAAIQLQLRSGDFYSRANQKIFEAVLSLDAKGLRADIQTVVQELKVLGKLDEAGGASYVSSLTNIVPSHANIEYYVQMVKSYSLKRALLKLASTISVNANDDSKDSKDVLEDIQKNIFQLSDEGQIVSSRKLGEVLKDTIDIIDHARKSKKPISGIPSGFDRLDLLTAGFQRDEFIVIGARPSVGKTALALNMAAHIAFQEKIPTAFFSLEMSEIALAQRLISSEAMVNAQSLRSGFLSSNDYNKILSTMGRIYEAPLYIVDIPNMELLNLRTQARKLKAQQNVEIIFVDYLGLIGFKRTSMPRFEQFSEISRSIKSLARELHIPIVVLCQLNREAQVETPTLAHLRDSGSIEQDADLVLFLNRESKKGKNKNEPPPVHGPIIPTDLIVAKQRNGPTGIVKLALETKVAKFTQMTKEMEASNE